MQKDVYFGLERGAECLREIRKEMGGLERVEELVRRGEEERAFVGEVGELLGGGGLARAEEEEVEDELGLLERESRVMVGMGVEGREKEGGKKTSGEGLPEVPAAKEEELPETPADVPINARKNRKAEEPEALPA